MTFEKEHVTNIGEIRFLLSDYRMQISYTFVYYTSAETVSFHPNIIGLNSHLLKGQCH